MNSTPSEPGGQRPRSFFSYAAWYCLLVPATTFVVTLTVSQLVGRTSLLPPPSRHLSSTLFAAAFWLNFSALLAGVCSLFGVSRHGKRFILWKAVPGLVVSGLLGFLYAMLTVLTGISC